MFLAWPGLLLNEIDKGWWQAGGTITSIPTHSRAAAHDVQLSTLTSSGESSAFSFVCTIYLAAAYRYLTSRTHELIYIYAVG